MSDVFRYRKGHLPLLVSVPHDGRGLAPGQAERMTTAGRALPDTDWHVSRLYAFAEALGAHVLVAQYSRYVVDLNRPADDAALYPGQLATGLCPSRTFAGEPLYEGGGEVGDAEKAERVERYWRPWHDMLRGVVDAIRDEHGYALLWDAHSIASEVPALFDGRLLDLNIGSNGGRSASPPLVESVMQAAARTPYSSVLDGRFRGGYITRHYGQPEDGFHALQLELSQRTYIDEKSLRYDERRAAKLAQTIESMIEAMLEAAKVMQ